MLARAESEEKWFKLDVVWNWRKKNRESLMGDNTEFPIQPLLSLVYGRMLNDAEKKHTIGDDRIIDGVRELNAELEKLIPDLIEAVKKNTEALCQSTALLEHFRDGDYEPPQPLMDEIMRIVSNNEELTRHYNASTKKTMQDKIRDLLGYGSDFATIATALAPFVPELTQKLPQLMQLLQQLP